jgi:hypothetical protein
MPIAVLVVTTRRPPRGNGGRPAGFGTPGGQGNPCAEWYGDVGRQAVRLASCEHPKGRARGHLGR